ncbi:hypothetical protein [Arthrobacter antioxidans]|uniref:hypothetical protein n=1 Tax=Arthrobacter antioxidans TaxID=2895818 RepID=UPI00200006A3|nr:hypothetical protein [Arthrobacter antioxidans]
MMSHCLASAIVVASRTWWVIAVAVVATAGSLILLQATGARVDRFVGYPPFDLQTPLSVESILVQAPLYDGPARQAYLSFLVVDTVFPLAASVLLCLVLARSLTVLERLRGFPSVNLVVLIPLVGALFDWTENVFFMLAIWDPDGLGSWAVIAVGVKAAKIVLSVVLLSGLVLTFAVLMLTWSTVAHLRTRRQRTRMLRTDESPASTSPSPSSGPAPTAGA